MKAFKDKIRERNEETECMWCGEPLFVGDNCVWVEYTGECFCSMKCRAFYAVQFTDPRITEAKEAQR